MALGAEAPVSFPHQFPCSLARVCREKKQNPRARFRSLTSDYCCAAKIILIIKNHLRESALLAFAYMRLRVLLSSQTACLPPPPRPRLPPVKFIIIFYSENHFLPGASGAFLRELYEKYPFFGSALLARILPAAMNADAATATAYYFLPHPLIKPLVIYKQAADMAQGRSDLSAVIKAFWH